jgi:hypothetical protein
MLLQHLRMEARTRPGWSDLYDELFLADTAPFSIHLAILIEPYLGFVLDRTKTVESRFSRNGCVPFGRVQAGDVVLLKRASGPVVGTCAVVDAWDYRLTPTTWSEIKRRFGRAMCPQEGFWADRREASYATLMQIKNARSLPDLDIPKRDRRGWVVLRDRGLSDLL